MIVHALYHAVLMLMQCLELCASKQQQERRKAFFSTEHIFRSSLGEPSVLNPPSENSVLNPPSENSVLNPPSENSVLNVQRRNVLCSLNDDEAETVITNNQHEEKKMFMLYICRR
jgi:hypothetical protein